MRVASRSAAVGAAGVMGLLCLTGCLSDRPGSSSLASVNIASHGADAIQAMTIQVFKDDDYGLASESAGMLVFEREATQRDQVMYGRYGEHLSMRVVVLIEPRRQGGFLVSADAYALQGSYETKVMKVARRPYMDLLNRVKANLIKGDRVE